jgi:hypothetical protein
MFCKNCGRQIPDEAAFCPACGTKRSGGDVYNDEPSGRDIKNLPNYTKENDLNRSGNIVDSNRNKFSLSGDAGQKKFSLANDPNRNKFSLSGSPGQKKFSLADKDDGGIVRITANREPAAPSTPTGFVNPLKDSGKTIFHDEPAGDTAKYTPPKPATAEPAPSAAPSQAAQTVTTATGDGTASPESGEPTGFVNPLKGSGQDIRLGSDGDRNEANSGGFSGDPGEIDSHMGFAIFSTFCCCLPTGIAAIVFASQVSKYIRDGNYEEAQKCADRAQLFCWISVGLGLFCNAGSSIFSTFSEILNH